MNSARIQSAGFCRCGTSTSDPTGLTQCPGCTEFFCPPCEELHGCSNQASEMARAFAEKLARKFGRGTGRRRKSRHRRKVGL